MSCRKLILEYRGVTKLKSTYTDKLPSQIDERHRAHSHHATSKASRPPGVCPRRTPICRTFRSARRKGGAFAKRSWRRPGYSPRRRRLFANRVAHHGASVGRCESARAHSPRIATCIRPRPQRCSAFRSREVSADQRRSAKAVNFGLIYGMSAFGLARQLGIGRGEAQRYVDLYFERYPGVKRYMDETRDQARELGYVETVFGGASICPTSGRATRPCASTRNAAPSTRRCRGRPPTSSSAR